MIMPSRLKNFLNAETTVLLFYSGNIFLAEGNYFVSTFKFESRLSFFLCAFNDSVQL